MTSNDITLIEAAKYLTCDQIDEQQLEEQCDTEEARNAIHDIRTRKWHYEEFACGME